MIQKFKYYLVNVLIAIDQLINAILNGSPDETLSSRAYRMHIKKHRYTWWLYYVINLIFFWQEDHCKDAYLSELYRNHLIKLNKFSIKYDNEKLS